MMWLVLIAIVICLITVLRKRSLAETHVADLASQHSANVCEVSLVEHLASADVEEDELIAIITAAIHEFAGAKDFEVVSIKQNGENWALTGRQNLLASRLQAN
jgi:hypothetical protein